jgi:hypothetical protein
VWIKLKRVTKQGRQQPRKRGNLLKMLKIQLGGQCFGGRKLRFGSVVQTGGFTDWCDQLPVSKYRGHPKGVMHGTISSDASFNA